MIAPSYEIMDNWLYKRSFGGPLLKCLLSDQDKEVIDEVHNGICSAHQDTNTLSRKILLQGYYWPNMVANYIARVRACEVYQKFAKKETQPATFYTLWLYHSPNGGSIS